MPKTKRIYVVIRNLISGVTYMNSEAFEVRDPWKFQAEVLELIEKHKVKNEDLQAK